MFNFLFRHKSARDHVENVIDRAEEIVKSSSGNIDPSLQESSKLQSVTRVYQLQIWSISVNMAIFHEKGIKTSKNIIIISPASSEEEAYGIGYLDFINNHKENTELQLLSVIAKPIPHSILNEYSHNLDKINKDQDILKAYKSQHKDNAHD